MHFFRTTPTKMPRTDIHLTGGHSGMYLLKKGRGSLGNVTLLIDESMLINNVHFREFSFRDKRVTLFTRFLFPSDHIHPKIVYEMLTSDSNLYSSNL